MNTTSISPQRLSELRKTGKGIDLIDVRTPVEYREVHVEFAKNIPLDQLDPQAVMQARNGLRDEPLYLVCHTGSRGEKACAKFRQAGYTNVVNVEGGTLACEQIGLPLIRGKKAISLERQVRIAAGSLVLLGAILGWLIHPACIGLSAFVGAGLIFAGITDTCGMGMLLARMGADRSFDEASQTSRVCTSAAGRRHILPRDVEATTTSPNGISFCMITDGKRPEKTLTALHSIKRTCRNIHRPFELAMCGCVESLRHTEGVRAIPAADVAESGRLGRLRNLAGGDTSFDVMVFVDDDILFPETWAERLFEFSRQHPWEVLGNRILLPDGSRFWDRATISPHRLVSYDHPEDDLSLYQTGGFLVIRRNVFEEHAWDDAITINADRRGGVNEDVEYSARLIRSGCSLSFDRENFVWHWDHSYEQQGDHVVRRDKANSVQHSAFTDLLSRLSEACTEGTDL
jgi:rhodanese-related sulfurtransferase